MRSKIYLKLTYEYLKKSQVFLKNLIFKSDRNVYTIKSLETFSFLGEEEDSLEGYDKDREVY
jgi:hypothetical protein